MCIGCCDSVQIHSWRWGRLPWGGVWLLVTQRRASWSMMQLVESFARISGPAFSHVGLQTSPV